LLSQDHLVQGRLECYAYHQGDESIIAFHRPAKDVNGLSQRLDAKLTELGKRKMRRFEYGYSSQRVILDIMGESYFHAGVQEEIKQYILNGIQVAASTVKDRKLRKLLLSSKSLAAATIRHKKKLFNQPDFSFIQAGALLPSLVGEIAFSQTSDSIEKKAKRYIHKSDGNIQAAIIVDIE
jgi:hypothetical protein